MTKRNGACVHHRDRKGKKKIAKINFRLNFAQILLEILVWINEGGGGGVLPAPPI